MTYAGKFNTTEELEAGYKNLEAFSTKKSQEASEFKAKLDTFTAPETYTVPADLIVPDETKNMLLEVAKESHLTQSQFESSLRKIATVSAGTKSKIEAEAKKKEEERNARLAAFDKGELDSTTRFIQEKFPKQVADSIFQNIDNPEVFSKMKEVKQIMTNNQVPGVSGSEPSGNPDLYNHMSVIKNEYEANEKAIAGCHDPFKRNELMARRNRILKDEIELGKKLRESRGEKDKLAFATGPVTASATWS